MLEETDYMHNMHKETFRQQICMMLTQPQSKKNKKKTEGQSVK